MFDMFDVVSIFWTSQINFKCWMKNGDNINSLWLTRPICYEKKN